MSYSKRGIKRKLNKRLYYRAVILPLYDKLNKANKNYDDAEWVNFTSEDYFSDDELKALGQEVNVLQDKLKFQLVKTGIYHGLLKKKR